MNPVLQLSLKQQLKLSPQLQQSIRLLQLSGNDLLNEIQLQVDSNPLLALSDDLKETSESTSNKSNSETTDSQDPSSKASSLDYSQSASQLNPEQQQSKTPSLNQQLEWQLEMSHLSTLETELGYYIIESLNQRGFLSLSPTEIGELFYRDTELHISNSEVEQLMAVIQQFEPLGCATPDVQSFLLLQLANSKTPAAALGQQIIEMHFKAFCHKQYPSIIKHLHLTKESFEQTLNFITQLKTHPTQGLDQGETQYIRPDLLAYQENNQWLCRTLTRDFPKLKINDTNQALLMQSEKKSDREYLQQQMEQARSFLQALESRHSTLQKVGNFIVQHQQSFFNAGEEYLKPLRLKDVAEGLELHQSTISRATSNKYIQTEQGVLQLKKFFSQAVNSNNDANLSSQSVKYKIKQFIQAETPRKPLSDNKIMQLLADDGISIARRTVSKYRESMDIPSSSQRKQLSFSPTNLQ